MRRLIPSTAACIVALLAVTSTALTLNPLTGFTNRELTLAPSVNGSPFVYFPTSKGVVYGEYTGEALPILAPDPARITKVEFSADEVTIKLLTAHLGSAKLKLLRDVHSAPWDSATIDQVLTLIAENGDIAKFVAAPGARTVHYTGCNHGPSYDTAQHFTNIESALSAKMNLCPVCFAGISTIEGLGDELELGNRVAHEVQSVFARTTHIDKQEALNAAGQRVLTHWPTPLRGYQYSFELVRMNSVNAVSCPGGKIFFSEELFDMCESEQEIECVLAHEITHVEMRHGYRLWQKAKEKAGIGRLFGALVSVVASKGNDAGNVAALAAIGAAVAIEIGAAKYSREMEEECDSNALTYIVELCGADCRSAASNVFRKLVYYDEMRSGSRESAGIFDSHPLTRKRIDFFDRAAILPLDGLPAFVARDTLGNEMLVLEIRGLSDHVWSESKMELVEEGVTRTSANQDGDGDTKTEPGTGAALVEVVSYHSDMRLLGTVVANNNVVRDLELKDMVVTFPGLDIKLDNKEDTRLVPGQTMSFYMYAKRSSGKEPLASIADIPTEIVISAGARSFTFTPNGK